VSYHSQFLAKAELEKIYKIVNYKLTKPPQSSSVLSLATKDSKHNEDKSKLMPSQKYNTNSVEKSKQLASNCNITDPKVVYFVNTKKSNKCGSNMLIRMLRYNIMLINRGL
jgi:hypothetical protein